MKYATLLRDFYHKGRLWPNGMKVEIDDAEVTRAGYILVSDGNSSIWVRKETISFTTVNSVVE